MIRAVVLLACLLVLAACGGERNDDGGRNGTEPSSGTGEHMRTMTEAQARQRAQEHIDRAVAALPVKPTLTLQRDDSAECVDPTDDGPRGRYEVGKTYWLDGLPKHRNAEFVDALFDYWVGHGFRVLTDWRAKDDRFVSVENNDDAFRMSVTESVEGDLSLGASSPCVWPDGVPPST
ncbi:hypothetical protein [Prauserella muralis]|uniref:Uncharacterized protein n=1 Tax=Prauserella muralis TaxID=588067 RepID=A0A2V4ALZ9_9PSEU|nr:hypothetical protein [Prauserella muralis]PXY21043.1 hypothetical protein BAY60_26580 [Prauserella muralis]TWE30118.1 hypothetical protein FHX69_2815 [Prauserella muralis]